MIDHDQLFKELLTSFLLEFLELFAPELAREIEGGSLRFLPPETFPDLLRRGKHIPDVVARVRLRGRKAEILVHAESQAQRRTGFSERMYRYTTALWLRHRLPVYPIAILSFERPLKRQPDAFELNLPGLCVVRFGYRVVQVNRLSWRSFLRQRNPVAAALMARMAMGPGDRPLVKAACLRKLAGLRLNPGQEHLVSGFVDTYLRLEGKEQTMFEKQVEAFGPRTRAKVMEIVTSWMEEGMAKGLEKGRQEGLVRGRDEGRQEGRQEGLEKGQEQGTLGVVLAQLGRRVGHLPAAVEEQVRGLGLEGLQALAVALLDFGSVRDLKRWLASRG